MTLCMPTVRKDTGTASTPQRADHAWARAYTGDSSNETHRVRAVPAVIPRPIQYMVCERIMARHQKNRKTQG